MHVDVDPIPWAGGKQCPHKVRGSCQLAAAIAAVPKDQTPVTDEHCQQCQFSFRPTIQRPNEVVALLANSVRENAAIVPDVPVPRHDPDSLPCIHRSAEPIEHVQCRPCQNQGLKELPVYGCSIKGRCAIRGHAIAVEHLCLQCDDRQATPPPAKKERQQSVELKVAPIVCGFMFDRDNRPADHLAGMMGGASAFLVCGGPSLNQQDLSVIDQRGILISAVNQVAATHVRPHLWFSVDPPKSFHGSIWEDPAICKFVRRDFRRPKEKLGRNYRVWRNGLWSHQKRTSDEMPNVWYYEHCDDWDPDEFLLQPLPTWTTRALNRGGRKSVMLIALRLLFWLGVRTVFLLGCDFAMEENNCYAFDQQKGPKSRRNNRKTYEALDRSFRLLRPHFAEYGFRVFNATAGGELNAFERIDLITAADMARARMPPNQYVTGLYR